ncbi:MAG: hypothetical protein WC538_11665 [Thermoanaerobaculia bacterium]|jgi:hypothetical protein
MSTTSDTKKKIETSIENARKATAERVEAIDRKIRGDIEKLRGEIDFNRLAAENAPQLIAAGVAAGIVLGYALPKPLFRIVQIAGAVGVATVVAKKIAERVAQECDVEEIADEGTPDAV